MSLSFSRFIDGGNHACDGGRGDGTVMTFEVRVAYTLFGRVPPIRCSSASATVRGSFHHCSVWQLCSRWFWWTSHSMLHRVSMHARDRPARRPAARVDHDEKLHQVVVDVGRTRGLHQENVAPANGFVDLHVHLPVRELLYHATAELHAEVVGDLLLAVGRRKRRGGQFTVKKCSPLNFGKSGWGILNARNRTSAPCPQATAGTPRDRRNAGERFTLAIRSSVFPAFPRSVTAFRGSHSGRGSKRGGGNKHRLIRNNEKGHARLKARDARFPKTP